MKEFSKHSNGTDGLSDGKKTEAIGTITGMFAYEGEQSKISRPGITRQPTGVCEVHWKAMAEQKGRAISEP